MRNKRNGIAQRKIARRTIANPERGVLEERSQDRRNGHSRFPNDEWDVLRSLAQDSSKASGVYSRGKENQSSGQLRRAENGVSSVRSGKSGCSRQNHFDVQRKDGNDQRQSANRLRFGHRPPGVNCHYCGRNDAAGCRCGMEQPARRCSRHNCSLVIMTAPKWGKREGVHAIVDWFEFLTCPVMGCGYSRSLKNPTGNRSENKKTTFVRSKTLVGCFRLTGIF
jgi:hypothetical protein